MSAPGDPEDFSPGDAAAPPMANGEVVFEEPWQGRVFGMARVLAAAGVFEWEEFRACLIHELARWESDALRGEPFDYWRHFQWALETLLEKKSLLAPRLIHERVEVLAARPRGHDHAHEHS